MTPVAAQEIADASPSSLLPSGATLSVIAALLEAAGSADVVALALALAGAMSAAAAWIMFSRRGSGVSTQLGARFFSIFTMALAISGLLMHAGAGWLGWIGIIGLWIAALGAAIEWMRGQPAATTSLT